jgi:hypothetical protein
MRVFMIWVCLIVSFCHCFAVEATEQQSLIAQSDFKNNIHKKAEDIDGRKKLYVGRVLIQATLIFPAKFFDEMTPKEKDVITVNGSRIEGNKLVMPASPLSGYVVRLGNQMEFIDRNGFFSFDVIPGGVNEGHIFAQLSDTKPFARFPVTKLVKNGRDEVIPIILRVEDNVDKILKKMDE